MVSFFPPTWLLSNASGCFQSHGQSCLMYASISPLLESRQLCSRQGTSFWWHREVWLRQVWKSQEYWWAWHLWCSPSCLEGDWRVNSVQFSLAQSTVCISWEVALSKECRLWGQNIGLQSQLNYFLAVWLYPSYFTSLWLSFFTCKIKMIIQLNLQGCGEDVNYNMYIF